MSLPEPVLEENQVYSEDPSREEENERIYKELTRKAHKFQVVKLLRKIVKKFEDPEMDEYFKQQDEHYFAFKVGYMPTGEIPCLQNIAFDNVIDNIRQNYENIASIKAVSHEEMQDMLNTASDAYRGGLISEETYEDIKTTYAWDKVLVKITGTTRGVYGSLFQVGDTIATVLSGIQNSHNICVTVTETDRSVIAPFADEDDNEEGIESTISA